MREQGHKGKKLTLYILIAFFVVIASVAAWKYFQPSSSDQPKTGNETTQSRTEEITPTTQENTSTNPGATKQETVTTSVPDQNVFSSLDIESFSVTIFYTKGLGPFSYQVMRTSSGTSYIEFQAEELIGTKCTDDAGIFASIIRNPSTADAPTLEATTKIGDDEYGLSLAGSNCTSNVALLEKYQTGFKTGFSSLRAYAPLDD